MSKKLLAVDAGKYATKAIMSNPASGEEMKISFRTKLSRAVDNSVSDPSQSFIISTGGAKYIIGKDASDTSISYETSKMNDLHRMAIWTAIGLLVDNGDEIDLVIGCPLSIYVNKLQRANYGDYVAPKHKQIGIIINGETKFFIINKLLICPESSGIIYGDIQKYSNISVGVIDIGGLNVNCSIYEQLSPNYNYSFIDELGSNKMIVDVQERLQEEFGKQLTSTQMNDLVNNGYLSGGKYRERSAELFAQYKKAHVEKIFASCVKHGWVLDMMRIACIGGSSMLLKSELLEIARKNAYEIDEDIINENSAYINVDGFMKYLKYRV